MDDFLRRRDVFENFDDDVIGREQAGGAALESGKIKIDEGFGVAGKRLETEQRSGVRDQDVARGFVWTKNIFARSPEQEFVSEKFKFVVEDRLAGDEFFEHEASLSREAEQTFLRGS